MRIARVAKKHESENPISLVARKEDVLKGEEKETEWEGWLWCVNEAGIHGWVPKAYLKPLTKPGNFQLLQDYSARELSVEPGLEVIVLLEESEWVWVRNPIGDEGWIPKRNLSDIEGRPSSIPDLS
ncbi:MAG: SH3 domain-containing protein [Candidatus Thorarchaeota archaeon]|jgi:hypothetical protein